MRDPKTGASIVQASGPSRGYYISETSLKNIYAGALRGPQTDPDYQTDAMIYPYIVLPSKLQHNASIRAGDYALAIHGATGRHTFAQVGDAKKVPVMGEASSALARALGLPFDRDGGAARGVVYVAFPESGLGPKHRAPLGLLAENGRRWLELSNTRLDLARHLRRCFTPEHPGVARALAQLGC